MSLKPFKILGIEHVGIAVESLDGLSNIFSDIFIHFQIFSDIFIHFQTFSHIFKTFSDIFRHCSETF